MQLKEGILFDDRYQLIKILGSGGFSEVWLAEDTKVSNQRKALKVYAPAKGLDADGVQLFSKEFELVFDINHTNLLRPAHFDFCDRSPYLILPYCEQGSAAKLVGKITEEEAWHFLHDVASGLAYLHEQEPPIIHQDIKPDNVLVDHKGKYLITDFGISAKARSTLRRSVGESKTSMTVAYSPPERFTKHHAPIMASDIWSLGATLFELLEGDVPFMDILGGQAQRNGAEIPEITGNCSPELKKIVTLCLQLETWNRPTSQQLVEWTEKHFRGEKIAFEPEPQPQPPKPVPDPKPLPRPRFKYWAVLAIACIAVILSVIFYLALKRSGDKPFEYEPEMVLVRGGTFTMGCTSEQGYDCRENEKPAHQVTVSDFQIGRYEVTQAQWQAVMGSNPSAYKGDSLSIAAISWDDVQEFIERLNTRTGKKYRLPTEAEWEYAARGGNRSKGYKYSGSNNPLDVGWYYDNSGRKPLPVGTKPPNELGLYDMSGNVHEWCSDWYGPYSSNAQTDPQGPSSGAERVYRGGGWENAAGLVRVSSRNSDKPGGRGNLLGFRLACNSK